ncbi:MAG: PaREP1 family protein [Candidatus Bathyarchaeia archaeon]
MNWTLSIGEVPAHDVFTLPSLPSGEVRASETQGDSYRPVVILKVSDILKPTAVRSYPWSSYLRIVAEEWPEIARVASKLAGGERLNRQDRLWVDEVAEATGWDVADVADDLRSEPLERMDKYRELFESYWRKAKEHKDRGDAKQAAEKLWGSIVALVKFYACKRGVPVVHWSRGKIEKFVTENIPRKHRGLFRDLLDRGQTFHEYFYEEHLDEKTFEERWVELNKLLEKAKTIVMRE